MSCFNPFLVKLLGFHIVCLDAVLGIEFFDNTNIHRICYKGVFIFSDQLLMEDVELKKQMCCTTVNWNENLKSRNNVEDETELKMRHL